ncbi:MAG TPA: hypothetical protein PLK34_02470 [Candidatus Pacearchaeota archaeon]|nr:hypothetical protein [Candidatus Pacearchaeota archaeon]
MEKENLVKKVLDCLYKGFENLQNSTIEYISNSGYFLVHGKILPDGNAYKNFIYNNLFRIDTDPTENNSYRRE